MAEFTQEQLDTLISEKVAEVRKGLYSEEDLQKKVTSEVDRRVETGIQKGLDTYKSKWEVEFQEKAKLSAEELAKKEIDEQLKIVSVKEAEINTRANKLEAKELLSEANIPKAHYEKFISMLVTSDSEQTKSNVSNFIEMFNSTRTEIETKVKSEFSVIPQPNGTPPKQGVVDKAKFDKMTYSERLKLKTEDPEKYKEFMKK